MSFKITILDSFKKDYKKLPRQTKKKVDKVLSFLEENLRHPSVRAKKISGKKDIWEGRINRFYRFSFEILGKEIRTRRVGRHDKTLKSP